MDSLAVPAFWLAACAVWAFFHFTHGQQRHRLLTAALWACVAIALGWLSSALAGQ